MTLAIHPKLVVLLFQWLQRKTLEVSLEKENKMVVKVASIEARVSGVWYPPVKQANLSFSHKTDISDIHIMWHLHD